MKKKFEKIKNEEKDFKNKSENEYEKYISFKEEYNNKMSKLKYILKKRDVTFEKNTKTNRKKYKERTFEIICLFYIINLLFFNFLI